MIVVADAGPLIHLAVVGHLELLPALFGQVPVPDVVFAEVQAGGVRPGALEIVEAAWVEVVDTSRLNGEIAALPPVLDAGERAALAVAIDVSADLFLCDDRVGRRECGRRGVRVVGTLGILVQAKRERRVADVASLISALQLSGFRASDTVVRAVLDAAGEGLSEE